MWGLWVCFLGLGGGGGVGLGFSATVFVGVQVGLGFSTCLFQAGLLLQLWVGSAESEEIPLLLLPLLQALSRRWPPTSGGMQSFARL